MPCGDPRRENVSRITVRSSLCPMWGKRLAPESKMSWPGSPQREGSGGPEAGVEHLRYQPLLAPESSNVPMHMTLRGGSCSMASTRSSRRIHLRLRARPSPLLKSPNRY